MKFSLLDNTVMMPYSKSVIEGCLPYSCGNEDLDDFFRNDALLYQKELLGKTYCFVTIVAPHRIVCMFTVANDSIKTVYLDRTTKNRVNRPIDNAKRGRSYPATLIGRLGVNVEFQQRDYHVGSQLIDFIKDWFSDENNKTGCRFLVVDAYNKREVLHYYESNGFKFLHDSEQEEAEYYKIQQDAPIHTRLMYYDLKSNV